MIAGGGPGGMLLAYLLARAGLPVTLVERHQDFDRDFRGDSLHPWTLELLDRLGLAERLLEPPPVKARQFRLRTPKGLITTSDYGLLDTPYDYFSLRTRVLPRIPAQPIAAAARSRNPPRR